MPAALTLSILLSLNVLFVLMEYALLRARPPRLELLARRGDRRAARVQAMLDELDHYLAAIQVGVTVVALALGAFVEPHVTGILRAWIGRGLDGLPDAAVRGFSLTVALASLAYVQIVLGELVPRAVALQRAESLALRLSLPLRGFALAVRPAVVLMARSSTAILRALGLRGAPGADAGVSEEELRIVFSQSQERGTLPFERVILHENLFDLTAARVKDAMVPRDKVAFLSLSSAWDRNLAVIRSRRFSRYPLCRDGLDDAVGLIHVKDLVLDGSDPPDLLRLKRDLVRVGAGEPVERLLRRFPDKGIHLALVTVDGGAVAGLVTLEDLFEELVGEVNDEFDLTHAWSLADLVLPKALLVGQRPATAQEAIRQLVERMAEAEPGIPREAALDAVLARERRFSSAVGRGIAVPHARVEGLERAYVSLARFVHPVPFGWAPDDAPIRLVFLVLTPAGSPVTQLRILSRIAALSKNETVRRRLLRARTPGSLLDAIRTADTLIAH